MNFIFQVQIIAKTDMTETAFQSSIAPILSILDDLTGILGHKAHKPTYYRPGELIDAPETWAVRWQAVLGTSVSRHSALQSLMTSLQPLLDNLSPSCTLQWKTESLDFLVP